MANKFAEIARKSVMEIKPYVPGKPVEEVEREQGIKDVIKLASNENPLGPSRMAVDAACRALKSANFYPDGTAYHLRRDLAEKLGVKPERLIFGNGSNEIINLIVSAFSGPGDEVMYSHLSFVAYPIAVKAAGATPLVIPHKAFCHDMDGFAAALNARVKVVFICNPNNPTGTMVTAGEFERFMEKAGDRTIVVLDEAYFEYINTKDYPDGTKYMEKYPNLVVLRTFSKIYGLAGLRIGYGVADPDVIEILERIRLPFNTSIPAQFAAAAALKDSGHVKRTIGNNEAGKKYLCAELQKLGIKYVEPAANFIFTEIAGDAKAVYASLLARGVIIRPISDNFARITIGTPKQNARLVRALKDII